jgi:non-ribosomal peptide synthetase component F
MHGLDEKRTIVENSHVSQGYDTDLSSRTAIPAVKSTQDHSTGARSEWAYRPLCVPVLFMMQSATTPGATAVSAGERALSYHELDIWTSA